MQRVFTFVQRWLDRHARLAASSVKRRRSFRPVLERLDERINPMFQYHGGPYIHDLHIHMLFLGDPWNHGSNAVKKGQIEAAVRGMTTGNSGYIWDLDQYGVRLSSIVDDFVDTGDSNYNRSGGTVTQDEMFRSVNWWISHGHRLGHVYFGQDFDNPNDRWANGENVAQDVWVLFIGPWNRFANNGGTSYHTHMTTRSLFINVNVPVALINTGHHSGTISGVTSEEIAEAATDPVDGGWYDTQSGDELSDKCGHHESWLSTNQGRFQYRQNYYVLLGGCYVSFNHSGPSGGGSTESPVSSVDEDVESIDPNSVQSRDPGRTDGLDETNSTNPPPAQPAAVFAVGAEPAPLPNGSTAFIISLPPSNQPIQDPVTSLRITSTDESAIDRLHARRSAPIDDGARDLLFSNLGGDQRDGELTNR